MSDTVDHVYDAYGTPAPLVHPEHVSAAPPQDAVSEKVDAFFERYREMRQFVEKLASFSTPYDKFDDPKRIMKARANLADSLLCDTSELTDEEAIEDEINDTSGDDCFEEAKAFWSLIKQARELVKP